LEKKNFSVEVAFPLSFFLLLGFNLLIPAYIWALGKATPGMVLNISRQGIFFIPVILLLPKLKMPGWSPTVFMI
jgi:Na+-driven multidrug efflux pump